MIWTNCYQNKLEDPAPSSQLGYGTVVLHRLALTLGRETEAADWAQQIQRHRRAIDSLWDEQKGYWIVTYRGTQQDDVLTSSIIYPIFSDLCRDPAKIKRVIEESLLNPKEFNGPFPIPRSPTMTPVITMKNRRSRTRPAGFGAAILDAGNLDHRQRAIQIRL